MEKLIRSIIILTFSLFFVDFLSAQTDVSGNVRGVWTTSGSPYLVTDTIYVQDGDTLIIEPGVIVDFQGHFQFYIYGYLQAVGTETDSICFTTNPAMNPERWGGLRFDHSDDSCIIQYCRIEYGKAMGSCPHNRGGGIYCTHCDPQILNNSITNNSAESGAGTWGGGGIYCDCASPTIMYNIINGNTTGHDGAGIYCYWSSPLISNNHIRDNTAGFRGGGIACFMYSNPIIKENIIENNSPSGIHSSGSSPKIQNNTIKWNQGNGIYVYMYGWGSVYIVGNLIAKNHANYGAGVCNEGVSPYIINNTIVENAALTCGGGIYNLPVYFPLLIPSNPVVIDNILYFNTAPEGKQVYSSTSCTTNVSYSDIHDKDSIGIYGAVVWGGGVIDLEPSFADTFYRLNGTSPCVDAGTTDTTGLYLLPYDLDYSSRVWDGDGSAGAVIDMGAYEYGAPPYGISEYNEDHIVLSEITIFPNPSPDNIILRYAIPVSTEITLELIDISGRKLKKIYYGFVNSGVHEITLDCSGLSSGVYFVRLFGETTMVSKKFIFLP